MVRKIALCITILLAAAALMMPACAFADDDTVYIEKWEDLKAFIDGVNDGSIPANRNASLLDNIEVPAEVGNDWVPLGKDMDHTYEGVFDGSGYAISGIEVDRSNVYPDPWKKGTEVQSYTAFCSFLGKSGTIQNLIVSAEITDVNDVAGIVSQNSGLIEYCEFDGVIGSDIYPNEASGKSVLYPEGVFMDMDGECGCIAAVNSGIINRCTTTSSSRLIRGGVRGGGIVGCQIDGGIVKDCENYADVTLDETTYKVDGYFEGSAGGIVGGQTMIGEEAEVQAAGNGTGVTARIFSALKNAAKAAAGFAAESDDNQVRRIRFDMVSRMPLQEVYKIGEITNPVVRGTDDDFGTVRLDPAKKPLIQGCENYGTVKSYQIAGGICGESWCGDIKDCLNMGVVDEVEGNWGGGVTGYATTSNALGVDEAPEISGCENYAKINPSASDKYEDTGSYYGSYIGGICGTLEDYTNGMTGGWAPVKLHNSVNYGQIRGRFGVGGILGIAQNGTDEKTHEGFVYELVNLGAVKGNQDVAGIAGACPGVVAAAINYGPVKISPVDDSEYYAAGGIAGDCSQTGLVTTSYNMGKVTKSGYPAKVVLLGGVVGLASSSSQTKSCYYSYQTSGRVTKDIGDSTNDPKGALKMSEMGGKESKTSMADLYANKNSAHAGTKWVQGENVEVGKTTNYMTPQIKGMEISLDDILNAGFKPSYPVDFSYAVVKAATRVYTGKEQKPVVTVKMGGVKLAEDCYQVLMLGGSYTSAGKYEVTVVAKGDYKGTQETTYTITKAPQKFKYVGPLVKSVKAGSSFKLSAVLSKGNGRISFAKTSGNKKIKVDKSGKVTVDKNIDKGKTYKVKVKVTAAAHGNYKKTSTIETLVINVKK